MRGLTDLRAALRVLAVRAGRACACTAGSDGFRDPDLPEIDFTTLSEEA
ncbi:hypothetical protein [Nonomuraea turkmeniaca]|nr:hypothetical protein [Nonomuraea turkmeniaca]